MSGRTRQPARIKDEFIVSISHELRTPLTSLHGFAHLLAAKWDRLTEEQRREFVGLIAQEADHLRTLVEGLLDLLRVEQSSGGNRRTLILPPGGDRARSAPGHPSPGPVSRSGPPK